MKKQNKAILSPKILQYVSSNQLREAISPALDLIEEYAVCVYLCGSLANTTCSMNFDIDLEVLVDTIQLRNQILSYITRANTMTRGRPLFDFNVYTCKNLKRILYGDDHFKIWSRIHRGKILLGNPIEVRLVPELAFQTLWTAYANLEEASLLVSTRKAYNAASFFLHEGISTFYFADLLLLKSKTFETKHDALQSLLGASIKSVESAYYTLIRRANVHTSDQIKILSIPLKSKVSANEYVILESRIDRILSYSLSILNRVQHLTETQRPS